VQVDGNDAFARLLAALDDDSARAVPEDDRPTAVARGAIPIFRGRLAIGRALEDVPVTPRHQPGVCFGTDHQNATRCA
jgi:hypothetical protein